jgi:hypothetical protein
MWIPSHVGLMGNERAEWTIWLARQFRAIRSLLLLSVRPSDFRPLSRVRMLDGWQCSWSEGGMGRYIYSILMPSVSLVPWFRLFDSSRCAVTSMNRMMSNHSCLKSHIGRINIVENLLCVCLGDYGTIDHVIWSCGRGGLAGL